MCHKSKPLHPFTQTPPPFPLKFPDHQARRNGPLAALNPASTPFLYLRGWIPPVPGPSSPIPPSLATPAPAPRLFIPPPTPNQPYHFYPHQATPANPLAPFRSPQRHLSLPSQFPGAPYSFHSFISKPPNGRRAPLGSSRPSHFSSAAPAPRRPAPSRLPLHTCLPSYPSVLSTCHRHRSRCG